VYYVWTSNIYCIFCQSRAIVIHIGISENIEDDEEITDNDTILLFILFRQLSI